MCTAISFKTKDHYFGRNLDLEYSYHETVTVTPRNFKFSFHKVKSLDSHYAIIGMAFVNSNYPLYYDATNEKGLSMAGLNFPGFAKYNEVDKNKDNVAPYELIPWILGQCSTIEEVKKLIANLNIVNINFSEELRVSPLHFMISDREASIVLEQTADGLKIYDNPIGVLTNNPPFDYHLLNLANYMNVTREEVINRFAPDLSIKPYSRGMGTIGLPGDLSSASRFVKAAFTKLNTVCGKDENESVSQFFHILGSVEQQKGCCKVNGSFEYTIYSSCCNTDKGIYYYKTYDNNQITAIDMHKENLDGNHFVSYQLIMKQQIKLQN